MRYNTLRNQLKWNAANQLNLFSIQNPNHNNHISSQLIQQQKNNLLEYMWLQRMVNDIHQYKENKNKKQNKVGKQEQKEIKVILKEKCLNSKPFLNEKSHKKQKSQQKRNITSSKKIKFQIIVNRKTDDQKPNNISLTEKKKQIEQKQNVRFKIKQNSKQIKCKSLPKKNHNSNISCQRSDSKKQKCEKKNIIKLDQIITETFMNTQSDIATSLWVNANNIKKQQNSGLKNNLVSYYQSQRQNIFIEKKKSIGKIIKNNDRLNLSMDKNHNKSKLKQQKCPSFNQSKQNRSQKLSRTQDKTKNQHRQQWLKKPKKIILNLHTEKLSQFLGDSQLYKEIKQKNVINNHKKQKQSYFQNQNVNQLSIIDRVDTVQLPSNFTNLLQSKQINKEPEKSIIIKIQQRKLNRSVTKQKEQKQNHSLFKEQGGLTRDIDQKMQIIKEGSVLGLGTQLLKKQRQKQFTLNSVSSEKSVQNFFKQCKGQQAQLQLNLQDQYELRELKPLNSTQLDQKINVAAHLLQNYYIQQISYIFHFLDQHKQGKLYNTNCLYRQLTYQLKILLNHIIDNIFTKKITYNQQQFIREVRKAIINEETCQFLQQKSKIDDIFANSLQILKYKYLLMTQMDNSYKKSAVNDKQQSNNKIPSLQKQKNIFHTNPQNLSNKEKTTNSINLDGEEKKKPQLEVQSHRRQQIKNLKSQVTSNKINQKNIPQQKQNISLQQPQFYFQKKYNLNFSQLNVKGISGNESIWDKNKLNYKN